VLALDSLKKTNRGTGENPTKSRTGHNPEGLLVIVAFLGEMATDKEKCKDKRCLFLQKAVPGKYNGKVE
jgi:hypothetical protein